MLRIFSRNVYLLVFGTFLLFMLSVFWNLMLILDREKCPNHLNDQQEELTRIKHFKRYYHGNDGNLHHMALIVPFRERFNQLLQFIPHMSKFLYRQNVSHEFFIINQCDKYRFNRGQLINVGYLLSRNYSETTTTYIAMHDVDLLPLNDKLSYAFPAFGPFHVSSPELHPKYHYQTYVGGILLMRNEHFELVNGFSNNYFGWGLEDDEFYARMKEANLKIYRPENIINQQHSKLTSNDKNTFAHIHDDFVYRRDTAKFYNQREVTRKRDRQTGLKTTRFQLLKIHHLTIEDVPFRVFDVLLHCDIMKTPWCQPQRNQQQQQKSSKSTTTKSSSNNNQPLQQQLPSNPK